MLALVVYLQSFLLTRRRPASEAGQATAEYAILLLAAAGVALLVMKWVGKTALIGQLLDTIVDLILGKIRG